MWPMTDDFGELVEVGPEDVTEVGPEDVTEVGPEDVTEDVTEAVAEAGAERLPAVVEARVIERSPSTLLPAVHAAAAAATGFVAGAAALALARRLSARRLVRAEPLAPLGRGQTRTFLVHVRVLD